MATTVITKNSSTASAVPVSGDLTQGELAVNVTDKRLFTKNSGGTVVELGINPSSLTMSGGTANGVAYLNGSKVVTTGSALTFDGTNLGLGGSANNYGANITYQSVYGSTAAGLDFYNGATRNGFVSATSSDVNFGALTNIPVRFHQNGSEQMRLTSTGLGIGTSSPGAKLHAQDSSTFVAQITRSAGTPHLKFNNTSDSNAYANIYADYNGFAIQSRNADNSVRYNWLIGDSSGNLGLGVTPSAWGSTYKAEQIGQAGVLAGHGSVPSFTLASNAYENSGWKAITTNPAQRIDLSSDNNATIFYRAASATAGTALSWSESARIDSSGNLLVNTTSASGKLTVRGSDISDVPLAITHVWGSSSTPLITASNSSGEVMRLERSGNLLVGTTSSQGTKFAADGGSGGAMWGRCSTSGTAVNVTWNSGTSGDNLFQYFYTDTAPNLRGSIDYNRAGGLVRYNTTSDYRAKDIIGPVQNANATVNALKVYEGVMKGATESRPMLIAHEAQNVVPFCVSGVKDEVNEDGTPKFQQMDHSSLVPLLVAAIQEQQALITQLTERITALEGK